MNLVLTTETYLPFVAGVSTSTDNIARFMAKRGHSITLVAPKPVMKGEVDSEKNLTFAYAPSIPDLFFAGKSLSPLPLPFGVLRRILKNIDLLHIQEPGAIGLAALLVAKQRHIKIVGALHFTPEQIFRILFFPKIPLFISLVRLYMRWFYNQCDGIMVPTATFAGFLHEIGVTKPVQVVSNGVNTNVYMPTMDRLEKRSTYNLPKDKILYFFLGRLDIDKHADTIIRALPKTDDSVHLVIAGEGKEERAFRALADSLGVSGKITWLGHLSHEQMLDVYQSVDVFVLMSPYEVQSIVTLQAISCALPVLACNEGALPELCHDGVNGYTIPFKDFSYLSQKMNVLATDAHLREVMGKESRKISLPHDQTTALTTLEAFYRKIIAS
jgi:glycosyltransferase involved in cell wall biosynthesis